jgi:hypothetical protein
MLIEFRETPRYLYVSKETKERKRQCHDNVVKLFVFCQIKKKKSLRTSTRGKNREQETYIKREYLVCFCIFHHEPAIPTTTLTTNIAFYPIVIPTTT